jgi:hypothetical protein
MSLPKNPVHEDGALAGTSAPVWESREGYISGTDAEGRPLVDFEGNPTGPNVALSTVPLQSADLDAALTVRPRIKLRFHDGDLRRPVIVGLAHEPGETAARSAGAPGLTGLEIREDADGVTLRVGKSSIKLMHDGKIILKGTYIETCAEGLNRIKGGTVDIG